jgi:hypothetical protein
MSYSAADLVNDLELNAETYGVPPLALADLADMGMDPASEHDSNRILAERVSRAMSDRRDLGAALCDLLAYIDTLARDFDLCRDIRASNYGIAARAAITRATRRARSSRNASTQ